MNFEEITISSIYCICYIISKTFYVSLNSMIMATSDRDDEGK